MNLLFYFYFCSCILAGAYAIEPPPSKTESEKQLPAKEEASTGDLITDSQARLELARVLTYLKRYPEALHHYFLLLKEKPADPEITSEISRLYIWQNKPLKALALLYEAIKNNPQNSSLLIAAADAEAQLGHAQKSNALFIKAISISKTEELLLHYADTMMMWGDFYKAENIYREELPYQPDSIEIKLKLAWLLVSAQRYEEAEALYMQLICSCPEEAKAVEALATEALIEKKFCEALQFVEQLLSRYPDKPAYLELKANIYFQDGKYLKAIKSYKRLLRYKKFRFDALIAIGRAYKALFLPHQAKRFFLEAYRLDPKSIPAQFYLAGSAAERCSFLDELIEKSQKNCSNNRQNSDNLSPQQLLEWAKLYNQNSNSSFATILYRAALQKDPELFPASIGLAEVLSSQYKFDEALQIYFSLLERFPENPKLTIAIARVYSWSKQYVEGISWYNKLLALHPQDTVALKEKARVALWGKYFPLAMATYEELIDPSFPLEDPYAQYLVRRSFVAEKRAKTLNWDKYYLHALGAYRSLLEINPGDQEALFDDAQVFCTMGLCDCSQKIYKRILQLDPNHNLVKMAKRRSEIRLHPGLQTNITYWRELGTGSFSQSQIARYEADLVFELPLSCRAKTRYKQHTWVENPFYNNRFYPAEGESIEGEYIYDGFIRASAGAMRKNYFNKFKTLYSGFNHLSLNFYDYLQCHLQYDKMNEVSNYFSMKQNIQYLLSSLSFTSDITHKWSAEATYQHLDYNDKNNRNQVEIATKYSFTDDPDAVSLILRGNYRNTKHLSVSIVAPNGVTLIDVIHPYWTPQKYYSGTLTLQWRHDYRYFVFCEAPERYFDLKLSVEDDTEENLSLQIAVDWKHEFTDCWGIELQGLFHRSKQWNAEGAWATISYRF